MARYDLNYKPWQRKMVDPNHPAGAVKYGVYPASPKGENLLMGGLAGSLLPLLPMRSIPSVFKKELSPQQLLQQLRKKWWLDRRDPGMYSPVRPNTSNMARDYRRMLRPQFGGQRGTRFGQQFRKARTTLDDLKREY